MTAVLTANRANRIDPTRTLTLRRRFESDMWKRFRELQGLIIDALIRLDVLGLSDDALPTITLNVRADLPRRAFAFETSEAKVRGFIRWLNNQADARILEISRVEGQVVPLGREPWTNVYVRSAYQKGIERGRIEAKRAGKHTFDPTRIGTDQRSIEAAFSQPFHVDRVGVLYSRTFMDLVDMTETMAGQIRRELTQGMTEGRHPLQIARRLNNRVKSIGIVRARLIARTEIIRAHHQATINEYEAAGVTGVTVKAEWLTAGDDAVCERCAELEGRIFDLDDIRGLIPLHPACRCVALPATEDTE